MIGLNARISNYNNCNVLDVDKIKKLLKHSDGYSCRKLLDSILRKEICLWLQQMSRDAIKQGVDIHIYDLSEKILRNLPEIEQIKDKDIFIECILDELTSVGRYVATITTIDYKDNISAILPTIDTFISSLYNCI